MTRDKVENIILPFVIYLFVFLMGLSKIADYDIFYHLATGKYILETGSINHIDPFSFTSSNTPWSIQSWLAGIIFYQVNTTIGGFSSLIIFKAVLITMLFFVLYKTMEITGSRGYLPVLILIVAAFVLRFRMSIRPHIFEFLFLATFIYILNLYKFRDKNYLFILPIIQLFWVNIHGSHILGLIAPMIFLAGESLRYMLGSGGSLIFTRKQLFNLTLTILAICISTIINPAGFKAFLFPFFLTGQKLYMQNIYEWQPLRFAHLTDLNYGVRYTWGFSLLLILGICTFIRQFKKIDITELLIFAVFLYLALKGIRLLAEFAIVVAPIVTRGFPCSKISLRLKQLRPVIPIALILCMGILFYSVILNSKTYAFGLGLKERVFPVKAVDFLIQNNINGNMFNSIGYGGYLIWRLFPKQSVFIDGRNDVYNEDFYKTYLDVHFKPDVWNMVVNKYAIDWVITEYARDYTKKERMSHLIDNPEWSLIYWDREAIVYAKRNSKNDDIIKKYGYKYARPNDLNPTYLNKYISQREMLEEAAAEFQRNLSINPDNEESHLSLAYIYFTLGMRKNELEEMKKVVAINPELAFAHAAIGEIYVQNGDLKAAEKEFSKALDINPSDNTAITGMKRIRQKRTQ